MHVAIRADGGTEIGYGHIVRTSAIAVEALKRNNQVTYVTTTPESIHEIVSENVLITTLKSRNDPEPFSRFLQEKQPNIVLSDAYPVDTEYQRIVRSHVPLAVLSDDTRHAICADLLINGNLYADSMEYEFVGTPPKEILGPNHVPLRERISELAECTPPCRETAQRALVTMGGSDMAGLTPVVLRAFDGVEIAVDAIVGPGFSEALEEEIRTVARRVSAEVCVRQDPSDLPERMFEADFAVSTASTTTYELLALGTPIISRPVVDNQEHIAAALDARDAAIVLDRDGGEPAFHRAIETYTEDPILRYERRLRGRELVDGRGAKRIVDELEHLAEFPVE